MAGMFDWFHRKVGVEPPFVLAGVMHYGITDVHPFADGNGRAARLLQAALLMSTDVLPGRMFSFERYYAEDRDAYYDALRSVRRRTLNMEFWLEYFLRGLTAEYERVAETVADLSSLVEGGPGHPLHLRSSQEHGLAALRIEGRREFSRREYERAAGVKRTTAIEDLKELVRHGVLLPRGSGSTTRYVFSGAVRSQSQSQRRGRPAKWNDAAIERELQTFLAEQASWPSPQEFREAGHGDLYAAASRAGGIGRWRRLFGL
jgi:Fic family protein